VGRPGWGFRAAGLQDGLDLGFEEIAELLAAFDGFAKGAVAQGFEDGGGGLDAEIAGEQGFFKMLEGLLVDGAGERGDGSIFEESDSRVRETACFMRAKRPVGSAGSAGAGGSFLLPKNFIMGVQL